jgi:single-stranded DNA-binding protein
MRTTLNEVRLIGVLAEEPTFMQNDYGEMAVIKLDIRHSWVNKETSTAEHKIESHSITVFHENSIKNLRDKIRPGSTIIVKGSLQARPYTLDNGEARSASRAVVSKYDGGIGLLHMKAREAATGTPHEVLNKTRSRDAGDDYIF